MRLKMVTNLSFLCLLVLSIMIGGCSYLKDKPVNNSEEYPNKPITFIVPYSAGGAPDTMARAMEKMAIKHLGQPLVVINVPGGGATIGWNELAGAKPDGYTIGYIASGALLQPHYAQTRYHYPTALEPLAQIMLAPVFAVIRADQPWQNINDLVKYAKDHPGEIKFGHGGMGVAAHVTGEMFAKDAGINIVQVPFSGPAESFTKLLGGHIQLLFTTSPPEIKEYMHTGKIKVLAVASEQRLAESEFKEIPTFKEQGYNVVFDVFYGVGAPKMLPKDIKARLDEGLCQMINDPEFIKNMELMGMKVEYLGPKEFSEKWSNETERLSKIIKETGIAERIASQKN